MSLSQNYNCHPLKFLSFDIFLGYTVYKCLSLLNSLRKVHSIKSIYFSLYNQKLLMIMKALSRFLLTNLSYFGKMRILVCKVLKCGHWTYVCVALNFEKTENYRYFIPLNIQRRSYDVSVVTI